MNHLFSRIFCLLLWWVLPGFTLVAVAQPGPKPASPSVVVKDTAKTQLADTSANARAAAIKDSLAKREKLFPDTSLQAFYRINSGVNTTAPPIIRMEEPFFPLEKDTIFYIMGGMLLLLGCRKCSRPA